MADKVKPATKASGVEAAALQSYAIQKEIAMMRVYSKRPQAEFTMNASTLKPVAPKVGEAPAREMTLEQTQAFDNDVVMLKETLKRQTRTPQERAPEGIPETASQEVGWYHAEFYHQISKPLTRATHKVSEEVEFASKYSVVMGTGPYNKTQPIAR